MQMGPKGCFRYCFAWRHQRISEEFDAIVEPEEADWDHAEESSQGAEETIAETSDVLARASLSP